MATALLEVDFQEWVVALASDPDVVQRAAETRRQARARRALVYCLRYLDPEGGRRGDPDSVAARFVAPLAPRQGDRVCSKGGRDPFANPDLHDNLRLAGVDEVWLDGLLTDHGVASAARSALRLGYRVAVIAAGCAATTAQAHAAALGELGNEGIVVVDTLSELPLC